MESMPACAYGDAAARATGGAGRWAVAAVCGGLVYYHCAVRRASAVSLAADVLLVLLCSLSILGLLFRHLHISVPVDPLEWQISQEMANSIAASLANTIGAAESVLRVAATGHDKKLFFKVVFTLYFLAALGRLVSGAAVAYAGFPPFPSVMDINQIREILPHRFPFLLVDRVIEYKAGEYAVGIKNVTINDNFFPGHFPERPIMPGVLMVEAMAQVGGLVMLQPEVGGSRDNFFFVGIDKVRFRKPVIAGDTLVMRMTLTKYQKRFGLAKMEGKAYVGGDLVCEGEFLLVSATE